MRIILKTLVAVLLISGICFNACDQSKQFKCLLQMSNYVGEGAYVVVSLIDSKNTYEKTLYVMGSDKKWYKSIEEWNKFYSKKPSKISAITGASVTGGDCSITSIEIETSKIDAGYKLRFESAVESKKYYVKDVEVPLTTQALSSKTEGTGYIRYVRFSANQAITLHDYFHKKIQPHSFGCIFFFTAYDTVVDWHLSLIARNVFLLC